MTSILKFAPRSPQSMSIGSTLADGLERLAKQIRGKQIDVKLHLAPDVANAACVCGGQEVIEEALENAVARSPRTGEVTVFGLRTSQGIELEFSDEGESDTLLRNNAFAVLHESDPRYDAPTTGRSVTRLPQGGLACTILLNVAGRKAMAA